MSERKRKHQHYRPSGGAGSTGPTGPPAAPTPEPPEISAGPTGARTVELDQCPACGSLEWFTKLDAEKPVKVCRGCGNSRP